jgi:hypothetical protein
MEAIVPPSTSENTTTYQYSYTAAVAVFLALVKFRSLNTGYQDINPSRGTHPALLCPSLGTRLSLV